MINKLLNYVKIQKLNDPQELEDYKNKKLIKGHYEFVSDFKSYPDQLVFIDIDDLIYWIEYETSDISENEISNILDSSRELSYFFKDYRINEGKLSIIQNVLDGDLERALYVAKVWKDNGIVIGFLSPKLEENVKYAEHTLDFSKAKELNVFKYDNNQYAAILFF